MRKTVGCCLVSSIKMTSIKLGLDTKSCSLVRLLPVLTQHVNHNHQHDFRVLIAYNRTLVGDDVRKHDVPTYIKGHKSLLPY